LAVAEVADHKLEPMDAEEAVALLWALKELIAQLETIQNLPTVPMLQSLLMELAEQLMASMEVTVVMEVVPHKTVKMVYLLSAETRERTAKRSI